MKFTSENESIMFRGIISDLVSYVNLFHSKMKNQFQTDFVIKSDEVTNLLLHNKQFMKNGDATISLAKDHIQINLDSETFSLSLTANAEIINDYPDKIPIDANKFYNILRILGKGEVSVCIFQNKGLFLRKNDHQFYLIPFLK